MKKKLGNVFLLLLFVGVLAYLLVSAVFELTNKEDLHTVRIDAACEVLELEHSINGLIPIGTDHYYIGIEEETMDAYIIKASGKWLEQNFDSDYRAINSLGVHLTALAKKVSDYDTAKELRTRMSQIEGVKYPVGTEYYLDLGYRQIAILKLMLFVLSIILVISGAYIMKSKGSIKPIYVKIWLVAFIICLVLLLWIIK